MSSLSLAATGLVCLTLFGTFYWLNIFATIRAILAFAGTCLIGGAGWVGRIFTDAAGWIAHFSGVLTQWAFGAVAVGALVIFIPVAVVFVHDLHPRHIAGKRTGWAGVALAALLIAGVSGIQAANSVPGAVRNGVNDVKTTLSGG